MSPNHFLTQNDEYWYIIKTLTKTKVRLLLSLVQSLTTNIDKCYDQVTKTLI